jgi:hypothetical protein
VNIEQAYVSFATLDAAYIGAVEVTVKRKRFL